MGLCKYLAHYRRMFVPDEKPYQFQGAVQKSCDPILALTGALEEGILCMCACASVGPCVHVSVGLSACLLTCLPASLLALELSLELFHELFLELFLELSLEPLSSTLS